MAQGIPPDNIALDDSEVTSTYGEVVRLREFIALSATHVRSVIVVSDPYHMRRARWTYEKVLGDEITCANGCRAFRYNTLSAPLVAGSGITTVYCKRIPEDVSTISRGISWRLGR